MKSVRHLRGYPAARPLPSAEILEVHAARLLLLVDVCGTKGEIVGLTKLAKLDFFVRYPRFFAAACRDAGQEVKEIGIPSEAPMVRHHYGPWDHRYYRVLGYLSGRRLLVIKPSGARAYSFAVTDAGREAARLLVQAGTFDELRSRMVEVDSVLGDKKGSELKSLVYRLFDREIAQRRLGEVISE